jgi:alpha-tubulin suppressor-like RCC1 family protein
MKFLNLNKQYIAAGESFQVVIDDQTASIGDVVSYTVTGPAGLTAVMIGQASLSGSVTLDSNKKGIITFNTTTELPTTDSFVNLTISSAGATAVSISIFSAEDYKTLDLGDKITLGNSWNDWRKKTNGLIAKLDTYDLAKLITDEISTETNNAIISVKDNGVTTSKIADSNVTTSKIADSSVTTSKIADSNVTTAKILDSNVTTSKIADSSVTTAKIGNLSVTTSKIADSNVTTAKILDSNVTTAKIADSNVTTSKIADSSVTTAKILDSSVTTAKILDSNVTTAKIADSNVTTAKILDSNVTTSKIASNAITFDKMSNSSFIDDDTMATASSTTLATSESIKAYVDKNTVVGLANGSGGHTSAYRSGGVILNDGTLRCWGWGDHGQLGIGTLDSHRSFPVTPAFPFTVTGNIVKWERSGHNNLVLMSNGDVWGWGHNGYGVLGLGNTTTQYTPQRITNLSSYNIVDIVLSKGYNATASHALFLSDDGKLLATGYNGYGQLGSGNTTSLSTPYLHTKTDWTKIYAAGAGAGFSMAIDASGDLYAWGWNGRGNLGIGNTTNPNTPQLVNAFGGVSVSEASISAEVDVPNTATYATSACLLSSGAVYTWGWGADGQLGTGNTTQQTSPQHISSLGTDNTQVLVGVSTYGTTYVLKDNNGGVFSTGYNGYGQQGNGTTTYINTFTLMSGSVRSDRTITKIHATGLQSYSSFSILWDDGLIKVCGYNGNGNLGVGHTSPVKNLTEVLGLTNKKPINLCSVGRTSEASLGVLTEEGNFYQTGYAGDSQFAEDDDQSISTFQLVQFV